MNKTKNGATKENQSRTEHTSPSWRSPSGWVITGKNPGGERRSSAAATSLLRSDRCRLLTSRWSRVFSPWVISSCICSISKIFLCSSSTDSSCSWAKKENKHIQNWAHFYRPLIIHVTKLWSSKTPTLMLLNWCKLWDFDIQVYKHMGGVQLEHTAHILRQKTTQQGEESIFDPQM